MLATLKETRAGRRGRIFLADKKKQDTLPKIGEEEEEKVLRKAKWRERNGARRLSPRGDRERKGRERETRMEKT